MTGRAGESSSDSLTLVIFDCAGARCALRREAVSQIAALPALSRPPNLAPPVAGFVNRGGETLPVLRTGVLLGQADGSGPDEDSVYSHIIFVRARGEEFGLLVSRVADVRVVPSANILPAGPTDTLNGCVEGVLDGQPPIHLLVPARLLLSSERQRLAGLVAAERARIEAWDR